MAPDWRIYYADGATFDSNMGEPHEAPPELFVLAIGYDEEGKRYIMLGWDFYYFDRKAQQWWGVDETGLKARLRRNMIYAYKEGWTLTNKEFREMNERAKADPDFPQWGRE